MKEYDQPIDRSKLPPVGTRLRESPVGTLFANLLFLLLTFALGASLRSACQPSQDTNDVAPEDDPADAPVVR